jgi:hypothetical protein
VGLITIATCTDDFTAHVATMIFNATKGHNSDGTVLKFSPISPSRTHAHQILNTRESKGFEDLKQYVLHAVLLGPGPQGGR